MVKATALRATLAAAILVSGATATACDSDNADTSGSTTSTAMAPLIPPTPSTAAETTPTEWPHIGDEVRDGPFAFVVISLSGSRYAGDPDNEYLQSRAQGLYLMFDVQVSNISSAPQTFHAANQTLHYRDRVFAVDKRAALWADSERVPINPGNTAAVKLAFDCPSDIVWRDETGYHTSATSLVLRGTDRSRGVAIDIQYMEEGE